MFEKVHCPLQTSRFCYIFRHEESFEVIVDKAAKKPTAKRQAFGKAGGMCLILDFVLHGLIGRYIVSGYCISGVLDNLNLVNTFCKAFAG